MQLESSQLPIFAACIAAALVVAGITTGALAPAHSVNPQPQVVPNASQFIKQYETGSANNSRIEDRINSIVENPGYFFVTYNVTFKSAKSTVFVTYEDMDNITVNDRVSCYVYATKIGNTTMFYAGWFEKIE